MTDRIAAVIVTYDRKELLRQCLDAVLRQTRPSDAVLVVDNGSSDGTAEMLRRDYPTIEALRIEVNAGASPAFRAGMAEVATRGYDWIFIMDDDAVPAPDCLEQLTARASLDDRDAAAVYVPVQVDNLGDRYGFGAWRDGVTDVTHLVLRGEEPPPPRLFMFAGALIARRIITGGRLPDPRFYIWFDDYDFALRMQHEGSGRVVFVPEAVIEHGVRKLVEVSFLGRRSMRMHVPSWKIYYGTRNQLYTMLRLRPVRRARALIRYFSEQARRIAGELVYDADGFRRATLRVRGIADGALGRMGKRL